MDFTFLFFLSSGLFLGWSLGANDASNIFGTAVGSKMVKFRTAAIISSIFVTLGAVFGGQGGAETLGALGGINALAGAFMVALSAALTLYWMAKTGLAVSTSQAIVGGIIGWNLYSGKPTDMSVLTKICSTWVLCPILTGIIAVLLYLFLKKIIKKSHIHLLRQDYYIRIGLIIAGALCAYSLGANNIANVMGVFVASSPFKTVDVGSYFSLSGSQVLFLLGGVAISVGIITYSKKVMMTIGNSLMKMTPLLALVVVLAQSLTLFLFSSKGLQHFLSTHGLPTIPLVPVSSTQAVIGAILGLGLLKGGRGVNWGVTLKIFMGWVFTPLITLVTCFVSMFFLQNVFNMVVYLP